VARPSLQDLIRSPGAATRKAADTALWTIPRWRYEPFDGCELLIRRVRSNEPFHSDCGTPFIDRALTEYRRASEEVEYLIRIRDATVEPRYGFAFLSPFRVAFESLNPRNVRWPHARASITELLQSKSRSRRRRTIRLPAALSLRDFNEANYWHFFNDLFPKLLLAREWGLPESVPMIVGQRFAETSYFEFVAPILRRFRPLIIQDVDTYVEIEELFWGATLNGDIAPFDTFLDELSLNYPELLPPPMGLGAEVGGAAAFITRGQHLARRVHNLGELHAICEDRGLAILDFSEIPTAEAAQVVRRYSRYVALHGAAITNLMFRRGKPTVIGEVLPRDWLDASYSQLAHHFGFRYRAMLSERSGPEDSYQVDTARFTHLVDDVLG
jgi:hypothetical protein